MSDKKEAAEIPFMANPVVGNILSILSGLSFLFLCMILPLVGPAAVHGSGSPDAGPAPHLKQNYIAFSAVLGLSIALGILALMSKVERRKVDGSPLPYYTIGLLVILGLLTVMYVFGLLAI